MKCPNCHHMNSGGNFCESCGTPLSTTAHSEVAASQQSALSQQQTVKPNAYLESTKKISKMYLSYFLQVLKKPFASSQSVGPEHLVNAIITIILYSIFIPLMIYFGVKSALTSLNDNTGGLFDNTASYSPSFADFVIKPTFGYAVFILLVASFVFVSIKLGKANASYKSVITRFGSFLIPFVAIFAVALVLSMIKAKIFIFLLLLGFIGSIFIVPPLVIASYKKEIQEGLDAIYGTLLTYVLTFITIAIMANVLFGALKDMVTQSINSFLGI